MLIDHHTHTVSFSFDGRQTVPELLQAARDRSLDGVCLTEHYEKDVSYIAGQEAVFDLDDYYHFCMAQKDKVSPTDPMILYGIELGYLPHLDESYARLVLRYPFDAVIMSLHILDGEDPYVDKQIYRRGRNQVYGRYLEQLTEMITSCPDFDILGHFDYISRYADWPDRKITWQEQPDRFDALFRALIDQGKTLELNTATIRLLHSYGYSGTDAWPDVDLIRRYLELGGLQICLGSDAHDASGVGKLLPECRQWLYNLGLRYLTHYIGRQPVMTSIS
ncbi:MAG: histidinol-phosphatase HisJ family protein [Bacillota bacterium]|nr:histidinol-phosphatase HisJ family protein [Bacillota bacterium]